MGSVATIETGSGPPVLLVHGLNGFKEGWGPLPAALAEAGMRAVMVDLPGTGGSPRLPRTSPAALAAAIDPLVARLGPVAIVAHSLGAQVAMLASAARPGSVRSLALLAPWIMPRPSRFPPGGVTDLIQLPLVGRPLARRAIAWMRRRPERRRQAFLAAVADPDAVTSDPGMDALLAEAADRLGRADLRAMVDWAARALALDLRTQALRIAPPALVVTGDRDRIARPAGARWLAGALPRGRLLSLEGVGHFPHLEAAGRVCPAVVEHLG